MKRLLFVFCLLATNVIAQRTDTSSVPGAAVTNGVVVYDGTKQSFKALCSGNTLTYNSTSASFTCTPGGPDPSLHGGFLGGAVLAAGGTNPTVQFNTAAGTTSRFMASSAYWISAPVVCIQAAQTDGTIFMFQWTKPLFATTDVVFHESPTIVRPGAAAGCYQSTAFKLFPLDNGDRVHGVLTTAGAATATITTVGADVIGSTVIPIGFSGGTGTAPLSATNYVGWADTGVVAANENVMKKPLVAGTLRNFCIITGSTQSATGSLVVTVRVNGADSTIVMTVAAGAVAASYCDYTHTAAITDGQTYSVKLVNNATAVSAQLQYIGGELVPTNAGDAMVPFTKNVPANVLTASTTNYWVGFGGGQALQTTPAPAWYGVPRAFTFTKVRCYVDTAPATSSTVVTLYKDSSSTAITGSITTGFAAPGVFTTTVSSVAWNALQAVTLETATGTGNGPILGGCVASGSST